MDRAPLMASSVLGQVVAALADDPTVALVSIEEAFAQPAVAVSITERPQSDERLARAESLLAAEAADERFASIAETPDLIRAERRLALLAMLSSAWAANPVGWARASDSFLDDSERLRASVQVAEIASLLLVADNDQYLPVNVDNALDQAVTVYVTLRPTTAVLAVLERRVSVVVPPTSQVRVDVPVQSLTNGTVDFVVSLSSADGRADRQRRRRRGQRAGRLGDADRHRGRGHRRARLRRRHRPHDPAKAEKATDDRPERRRHERRRRDRGRGPRRRQRRPGERAAGLWNGRLAPPRLRQRRRARLRDRRDRQRG